MAIYTTTDAAPRSPQEIVAHAEARYGLPPGALDKVWSVECSRQRIGGAACRNTAFERGAFQMTRLAVEDVGCDWPLLGTPGQFSYEAECSAAYLSMLVRRCNGIDRAIGAYNSGRCTARSRYARKVTSR